MPPFTPLPWRGRAIRWSLPLAAAAALGLARWIKASDHKDSALLAADHAADIADVYTFKSPVNPDNVVLVMTVSGFIPPSEASTTSFDPNVLYQWKIANNGDVGTTSSVTFQMAGWMGTIPPPADAATPFDLLSYAALSFGNFGLQMTYDSNQSKTPGGTDEWFSSHIFVVARLLADH